MGSQVDGSLDGGTLASNVKDTAGSEAISSAMALALALGIFAPLASRSILAGFLGEIRTFMNGHNSG